MINVKNKTILLTGATGGIGKEIVRKYVEAGADVIASGTNEEKISKP